MAMPTLNEYREADKGRIHELEDTLRDIIELARDTTMSEKKRLAIIEYTASAPLLLD